MDLKQMQVELQKLSAIINGWVDPQQVTALERDLALEKLRRLYDAVLFDTDVSGADEASQGVLESIPTEIPLGIDLGEILALESLSATQVEPETAVLPDANVGLNAESVSSAAPAPISEAPTPDVAPAIEFVADVEDVVESEDISESEVVAESEDIAESEVVAECEDVAEPEDVAESEVVAESENVAEPEVVIEQISTDSASAPQPTAPTLFGLEETTRHQHKQRVIMSLYHNDPAPALRSISEQNTAQTAAVPVTTAAEVPTSTPVSEPEPEQSRMVQSDRTKPEASHSEATKSVVDTDEDEDFGFEEITIEKPVSAPKNVDLGALKANVDEKMKDDRVLGDVINHDVQTLGDTIARPRDVASELRRNEHITQLRRAIGINDKFLLIRDLFNGDAATYEAVLDKLDSFDDLDECMIHIAENYTWNANSDGAKLLVELLERKFA